MSVLARFKCQEKTERASYGPDFVNVTVKLYGVMGEPFGKATPHAQCEMTVTNKAAADAFVLGQEYFVDFTPVPPEAEPAPLTGEDNPF